MATTKTQAQILESILHEISEMKTKLPNGELKRMELSIQEMKENYIDIKEDVSEIKYTLLNPENGVIVRVNRNTEFRLEKERKEDYYENKIKELEKMLDWKEGVNRALWILFTSVIGLIFFSAQSFLF
jgi:hypothetical protein